MRLLAMILVLTALAACDATKDTSDTAARITKQTYSDARDKWRDVFTYHPRPEQGPQTRYCYQMQSDVVCYDTPQVSLTSKLVGYQDGDHISYIQKGGGSLGVSTPQSNVFPQTTSYNDGAAPYDDVISPVQTGDDIRVDEYSAPPAAPNPSSCAPGMSPFNCNESPYVKGADVGR